MPSSVIVMWVTFAPSTQSMVKYGLTESALTTDVSGKMVKFDDGEKVRYMHTVELSGLKPGTKYGVFFNGSSTALNAHFVFSILGY